jgi:peptide/nickel transport system substrate-binding protein
MKSFLTTARGYGTVFALAALAIAGPVGDQAHAQKAKDTFRVIINEPISSLDYYMGAERMNIIMSHHLYDTLIYKDAKSGEFVPALAESYKVVDGKTIEFVIRQGVKFHDGAAMTADDVVYTLNKVSDPAYGALYKIAVQWIDRAEKVGDWTVRLHMKQPNPVALEWVAGFIPIYPKAYYEKVGKEGMTTRPIGTGPYKLESVDPGAHWTLKRFADHYKGSPKGNAIGTIDFRLIGEVNTQLTEMLTGGADFTWGFAPDAAKRLQGRKGMEVKNVPILRIVYMVVNTEKDSPLKDPRVRRAMMHALDREKIMLTFVGSGSDVINSACNPVQFGCETDVAKYEYNPEKAKALLAEAGYKDGFTLPMMVAINPTTNRSIQEALMANLATVGIKVDVTAQHWAAARESWIGKNYPVMLMGWGSWGIYDVAMMTSEFFNGTAVDLVKDEKVVDLIKKGDQEINREQRKKFYSDALKRIAGEAYFMPLWTYNVNFAVRDDVNMTIEPDEIARFFNATWK